MSKPLSNLDYLINPPASPYTSYAAVKQQNVSADRAVSEAAVALGVPILTALYKAQDGKQSAFELVDLLKIRLEELFPVLDVLAANFQWVDVDRSDRKGNYVVTLTPLGREYVEKTIGVNGPK